MSVTPHARAVPRPVPEGTVPLIAIEGTAYECGRRYAETAIEKYPGYRKYLDLAQQWATLPRETVRLVEKVAPHLIDLHRGLLEIAGPPKEAPKPTKEGGCTSFGVSGKVTLDGRPISGQTKDTALDRVFQYIVLRMKIAGAPTIMVLGYPGETLGHGFWTTGMSIFRNSLYSRPGAAKGLSMFVWGMLALAGKSVHDAVEIARRHGIADAGNCMLSDAQGESLSVEFNDGGIGVAPARDGIATHANHPEAPETRPADFDPAAHDDSIHRMNRLHELLDAERGRLTPQRALLALCDHSRYPLGICKHKTPGGPGLPEVPEGTTAAVVAEPTRGLIHVARGNPCCNWPVTYAVE